MQQSSEFRLIMISAMNENGGNTLHRFLDGHSHLYVYPFESQVGTPLVSDYLSSLFPHKYRWAEFSLSGNLSDDYELIVDEELKRHVKTPFASKFIDAHMNLKDPERKAIFLGLLRDKERTRANILQAFFVSTFQAWKDYPHTGKEMAYVGYSPIVGVDGEKILQDFPNAHVIHIVRNPFSAYADTKKRPVPYSPWRYGQTWSIVQYYALTLAKKFPNNFHLVRFEDMVGDTTEFFNGLTGKLGIPYESILEYPSWCGKRLENTVPWGVVQKATVTANTNTAQELSEQERNEIAHQTQTLNQILGYETQQ